MRDPLKNLDRAFTEAPPELSYAVEDAFRRGEQAMKRRYKMITTLAVAAGFAVAFAGMGLAGTRLAVEKPDRVAVALPADGAGLEERMRPSEAPALSTTSLPAQDANAVYYATMYGQYFHTDEHCGGMQAALPVMADAALLMGKQPCPVCCPSGVETQFCWATDQGQYYHHDRDCMGMWNATYCTVSLARARGQQPCPVCWGDTK